MVAFFSTCDLNQVEVIAVLQLESPMAAEAVSSKGPVKVRLSQHSGVKRRGLSDYEVEGEKLQRQAISSNQMWKSDETTEAEFLHRRKKEINC